MIKNIDINDISNHLLNNNLTFFIGAGFSNIFGYPSWGELLKDIIGDYNLKVKLTETSLFKFLDKPELGNLDDINNEIWENLIGADYLKLAGYIDFILKTNYEISIHEVIYEKMQRYEKGRIKDGDIGEIISFFKKYRENIDDIITTNYDSNIEFCLENNVSVINRNLESLNNLDSRVKLFKIHGCIRDKFYAEKGNRGKNIIITEKDYNNFKINNRYLFYKMYSLFIEKKIVFIGYSINDPNVRSILNDVIEETNNRINLQIYWVNRDKIKPLDKQYYQDYFKLNIIEEQELIDFIRRLDERANVNKELRVVSGAAIKEYSEKFISNYKDISYRNNIIDNNKSEEVYTYVYSRLIEEPLAYYIKPYFELLKNYEIDIEKNKLSIQNILEQQNTNIFHIVESLYEDKDAYNIIDEAGLTDILIQSCIKYTSGHHSFGNYATSIETLLFLYYIVGNKLNPFKEQFIASLSGNIRQSTSRQHMFYGYDWNGLDKVKKYIKILTEDDILSLINHIKSGYLDKIKSIQLEKTITYSILDDNMKKRLTFELLILPKMEDRIQSIIYRVLKSNDYNYNFEVGAYLDESGSKLLDIEISKDENIVKYLLFDKNNNDLEILNITQIYIKEENLQIIVADRKIEFKTLEEFKENCSEIIGDIEKYIEEELKLKLDD